MGTFVRLSWLDPYELFASRLRLSRRNMRFAFDEAFAAYHRCHDMLREQLWAQTDRDAMEWFGGDGGGPENGGAVSIPDFHYEAQVDDNMADWQASIVLLFADDTMQSFARGVLGKCHSPFDGYGAEYPDAMNTGRQIRFTTLLRAGTNTIRHVSDWDTPELPFPYPESDDRWKHALRNIDVIKRAFGLGVNGRIHDLISMRILIRVDGTLGDRAAQPQYSRIEAAMIQAAREIAQSAGGDRVDRLEVALTPIQP